MLDLVIWMFVLALFPLALGLSGSLVSGTMHLILVKHARSLEKAKQTSLSPR